MEYYVGLDVSLKQTSICVVNQTGSIVHQGLVLARRDVQVRRFMTVPGVGPITALCFKATIDDPTRLERSRSVGALYRIDNPMPCLRGDRLVRPNLEVR
jgi:Transposase IS116/IS110/IS902 family